MTQAVSVPVFGSSSTAQAAAAPEQPPEQAAQGDWQMDTGGDGMDFDLLAEYLLDDNPTSAAGMAFDFNNGESAANSTIVSPEQSVDGAVTAPVPAPPPPAPAPAPTPVHYQAAPAPPPPPTAQPLQPLQHHHHPPPPQPPQQHHQHYQTPIAVAPAPPQAPTHAPLAPAPAPIAAQPPMVAAQGISLPVPAPIAYAHPQTHIAPAPAVPSQNGVNTGIAQQPTTAVTKRRRMEVPMVAVSGAGVPTPPVIADPMAVAAALQGRGRKKTQAQIDRRRERNRILARRTRLRKKFFFESLQKEVVDLQRENAALKEIVRSELAADGQELLTECNASEKLPPAVLEACGENASDFDSQDFNLVRSIQQSQHSFVITDPSLQDNPIVFASDDFLNVTGYAREEVLGRNCRFLQGTETCQTKLDQMRKNLALGEDVSVTLVNYTADGTPFWNKMFIAALRDSANNIVNFIGVIAKVTSPDPDDPEAGKELSDVPAGDENMNLDEKVDSSVAAMVADGTVKAIEGAVDAAVAAAPSAVHG